MEIPNLEKGEIYIVKNLKNNKVYIGQVRSYRPAGGKRGTRERWSEHVRSANKNENKCVLLERAIREFGATNFSVEVLCFGRLSELDNLEINYISEYRSCEREFGYNMTRGGKSNIEEISRQVLSIKVTEQWKDPEFRKKVSEGVKKSSTERWKDPIARERMTKSITEASAKQWKDPEFRERMSKFRSENLKSKGDSKDLPEYVYVVKLKGEIIGYKASINHLNKYKQFGSKKLSMDEKFNLAVQQVNIWKKKIQDKIDSEKLESIKI